MMKGLSRGFGFLSVLLVLFLFISLSAVSAAEEETEVSSDTLEFLRDSNEYYLKGNVILRKGEVVLKADESYLNQESSEAALKGNVQYKDMDLTISTESAEFNLKTKTGKIRKGYVFIKNDNYHIWADQIEKKGEDHYSLIDARFTTCDAPLPAWCLSTSGADIIIGDRLKAGHVVLSIKGVPVLYTPYLWAPVLTERKTGLLFPELGYKSDLGFYYRQPLFIVLSDNRDATVQLDYYSDRGIGEGLEYRYIERGGIEGTWWGYHIRDDKLNKDFYHLTAEHNQYSDRGLAHFLSLNLLNEKEFFQEYSPEVETSIARFLESSGSVSYTTDSFRYYISSQYWKDLRYPSGTISQKLPTTGMSLHPVSMGPLLFTATAEATNFYSESSHEVQRYSLAPEISATVGNALRLFQTFKYLGSYYQIENSEVYTGDTERQMADYSVGLITSAERKYDKITHVIEPELKYVSIENSDYDAPLLDSQEALANRSDLILSLENKLVDNRKTFFSVKFSQPYSFYDEDLTALEGDLYLAFQPFTLQFEASYDHNLEDITTANGEAGFRTDRFHLIAGHRFDKLNDIRFYTGSLGFDITQRLSLDNSIWYDGNTDEVRNYKASAIYDAQCWALLTEYIRKPDDYIVRVLITLKGLGDIGAGAL